MITRSQMKIDLSGQLILLLLGVLLLVSNQSPVEGANWGLWLLLLWQLASAAYLWRNYDYRQRGPVFWILLFFFGLTLIIELSLYTTILCFLPILAYLLLTLRDTLKVYRRPRSFWDIG